MGGITITRGEGGLGRQAQGEDYISGLIFKSATVPSGITATEFKEVKTLDEAVKLGITKDLFPVPYYHISEFFKMREKFTGLAQGSLWLGFPAAYDGTQLLTMQSAAQGKIRQVGVFTDAAFVSTLVTNSQAGATSCEAGNMPLSVILAADFNSLASTALADMRALTAKNVSLCIGEDGSGEGKKLRTSTSKSVTCLGAVLGTVSCAAVHENIGWVAKFPIQHDDEYTIIKLATSDSDIINTSPSTVIPSLTDKGYVFLVNHVGITGAYFNDAPTAVVKTSDYAFLENMRTIDKAVRLVRAVMLPKINSPLYVDKSTGRLSQATISDFETTCATALEVMNVAGEISRDGYKVLIDPNQNVLSTSKINIGIKIVPVGVAREIAITIGFTTKLG